MTQSGTRAMLDLARVGFDIGGKRLLGDVSVAFTQGTVTAIVGPNGAGKSSLLKLASGEHRATRGAVRLDGTPIGRFRAPELAGRRAVVPQAAELAFPFSVREVVDLGASVPGFRRTAAEAARILDAALAMAHAGHLADRLYPTLSGGERQRVHFARAMCQLLSAPPELAEQVLLLDEPTASLDLAHQLILCQRVRDLAVEGLTVMMVLHDLNLAATFADQIVMLSAGSVAAQGSVGDVITSRRVSDVFGCHVQVGRTEGSGLPHVLPQLSSIGRQELETHRATECLPS